MRIKTRSAMLFPLVLLAMLALLTFWINRVVQPTAPKLDGSSRHDPDYIMSNFVTTQTDVLGALRYKLAAVEMRHFPDDDTTHLQRPRYTQFAVGRPYTQVQGLRGLVSSDGEQVELFGNVTVTRQAFADKGEMTVDTEYLKILPDTEIVTTESPVVIRQAPKTVIYATGMIYDKQNGSVTLLHKVRAHYEKPDMSAGAGITHADSLPQTIDAEQGPVIATLPNTMTAKKAQPTPQESTVNNARIRRRYE